MKLKSTIVILACLIIISNSIYAEWIVYNEDDGYLNSNNISSIYADQNGHIWIGHFNQGVDKHHNGVTWLYYQAQYTGLISDRITDIATDKNGLLWFSTIAGISQFDGDTTWESYNNDGGLLPHVDIAKIAVDDSGEIWLGAMGAGLLRFNGDTTIAHYTTDSGLIDNRILSLFIDDSNNIWIGGYDGVCKFDGVFNWMNFTSVNSGLLDDTVHAIIQDADNNIWFGSNRGLSRLSSDSVWTLFYENNNCPYSLINITSLAIDSSGNIWIGHNMHAPTEVRITKFDGLSDWTIDNLDNNFATDYVYVTDITVDSAGNVWIATDGEGVTLITVESTDIFDNPNLSTPSDYYLSQNHPNPFNLETKIEYTLPVKSEISLVIYNILGQKITSLVNQTQPAGKHIVYWDGTDSDGNITSSGIYFYQIKTEEYTDTKKLILMK